MTHVEKYFMQVGEIAARLDTGRVEGLVRELAALRQRAGRLFVLGVGGSAANASHAVNDFRKLCGIEAYTPVDNVAELTARTNDEGWETVFTAWLSVSHARSDDAILVLSVGGGDAERNISTNIVKAVDEAKRLGMRVLGIVGRASGHTARHGDMVVVIPEVDGSQVTPYSEAFQAVVWHCLVSHPDLQVRRTKW